MNLVRLLTSSYFERVAVEIIVANLKPNHLFDVLLNRILMNCSLLTIIMLDKWHNVFIFTEWLPNDTFIL